MNERNRIFIRQWTLLKALIHTRDGVTLRDLVAQVDGDVCDRTLRRDLEALGAVFPLQREAAAGSATRYRVNRDDIGWL